MATVPQQGHRSVLGEKMQGRSRVRVALSVVFLGLATCGFLSLWRLGGVKKSTAVGISFRSTVASTIADLDVPKFVCPRCEDLFSRLDEETSLQPRRDQEVRIHLRGEPKTGTGMMSSWAVGALARTCELLQDAFGTESCRVEPPDAHNSSRIAKAGANHEWAMVFEPQLSSGDQKCSCDAVGRVSVMYSDRVKHELPVGKSCPWSHVFGIPSYFEGCRTLGNGEPVKNYADLRSCLQESPCDITDHAVQFATYRDPRAVAVSTYFWIETHAKNVAVHAEERVNLNRTLDESIVEILESVCLWTSTRHILFNDLNRAQSAVFNYEEAKEDVLEWHYRWTHLAGLNLPVAWVKDMAALAQGGKWASLTKGINPHPGGEEATMERTWREEVSPELWDDIDAVVQRWLPCGLVEGLGLSCTGEAEGEGS